MTAGQYNANDASKNGEMSESLQYDKGGNITGLSRGSYGGLNYTYQNNGISNQLQSLSGFVSGNYGYDPNGNVGHDGRNNVDIAYNFLNLPQNITGNQNLSYVYDATGKKLRKLSGGHATDYIAGIQYTDGSMDFVQTEEGRAIKSGGNWNYEYTLTDHLGNSRVNIDSYNGAVRVTQEDEYYPFGLDRQRYTNGIKNKYLYNKKEVQEELGQYDYGARFYDPVVVRWGTVDPHATSYLSISPYSYVNNNPLSSIDPDGRDLIVLSAPNHVGGLGHAAVLIGNEQTGYRYYSKNGTTDNYRAFGRSNDNPETGAKKYASLKEFEASNENKKEGPYAKAYELKTDEATDKKMEAAAKASVESDYNVLEKNCIDVASDALKAGKLDPGVDNRRPGFYGLWNWGPALNPVPNSRFKDIMRDNPGGTLIILPVPKKEKTGIVTVDPAEITHTVILDKKSNQ